MVAARRHPGQCATPHARHIKALPVCAAHVVWSISARTSMIAERATQTPQASCYYRARRQPAGRALQNSAPTNQKNRPPTSHSVRTHPPSAPRRRLTPKIQSLYSQIKGATSLAKWRIVIGGALVRGFTTEGYLEQARDAVQLAAALGRLRLDGVVDVPK